MTKSELIARMAAKYPHLPSTEMDRAVRIIIQNMAKVLASGRRIEIRGFGSFCLHYRAPRKGRNPKTGEAVELEGKHVPYFKAGKELRDRVDGSTKRGE